MEADAALVRANGIVELDAVTQIDVHLAAIVAPGHSEGQHAVRLDHTLHDFGFLELRMFVVDVLNGVQHFTNSLQILLFARMLRLQG